MGRLVRTASHLKASQILWRSRYSVERRLASLPIWHRGQRHAPPAQPPDLRGDFPDVPLVESPQDDDRSSTLELLTGGQVRLCGITRPIGGSQPDWHLGPRTSDRLWTIALHYHGWLHDLARRIVANEDDADQAESLFVHYLEDWIDRCPLRAPGARDLAWNSYAVSTRIIWWIRIFHLLRARCFAQRPALHSRFLASLAHQADFLSRHLEWDVCANHLMRNVCALAWAGRFVSGRRAKRWLARAERLTVAQLDEQIGTDGAHFEGSPSYHLHVMQDVHQLGLLLEDGDARDAVRRCWSRMARYAFWMQHPDDDVPLLNDAGLAEAALPADVLRAAETVGWNAPPSRPEGGRWFSNVGLAVWHGDPWHVFFDAGAIGPDVQPGHGHADTLTLECSVGNARLLVDPGTLHYDQDDARRYDRSTSAHNTVCIDGTDSSEVWGVFRVGRRARVQDTRVEIHPHQMRVTAAHDGYRGLPGAPIHRRSILVENSGTLQIDDTIEGDGDHDVTGGWLLDPRWILEGAGDRWRATQDGRTVEITLEASRPLRTEREQRPYHARFGEELMTHRIVWRYQGQLPLTLRTVVAPIY